MKEFNIAPLSSGYMITSIIGLLISVFYVVPTAPSWGFTFVVFFTLMFVAAMVSMTYAPTDWQLKPFRKNIK